MKNMIGISLETLGAYKWPDFLKDKRLQDFQVFEINRQANQLPLSSHIDYEKEIISRATFSLHSGASFYFVGSHIFNKTARDTLLAEIELCKILQIKKLIFHIRDNYCPEIIKFLKLASSKAKKNNVQLILENNHRGTFSKFTNLEKIIKLVDLKINIDLGHLKVATGGDVKKAKQYITALSDRIVYVHLHTNKGDKDSHEALNPDDQFAKNVVSLIKTIAKNDIWWIMENNTLKEALESKKILEKLLNKKG